MRKHKKGFTIVELVIVIGVIGILSAILIPTFVGVTTNAKEAALQSNLANAYSAYAAEAADGETDTTKHAIVFKSQAEVSLTFENETYVFNTTDKKWVKGTEKSAFVVTAGGDQQAESTFNGAVVKYNA